MKLSGRLLFTLGIVILLAFLIFVTMGYNAKARLVPLVVLIPGLGFAVLQLALDIRDSLPKKQGESTPAIVGPESMEASEEEKKPKLSPREKTQRELIAIGWLLGLFALIVVFGLTLAIPLFVFLFMRFFGRESVVMSVVFSAACFLFVYVIFVWALQNQLYPGVLIPLFYG